MTTKNRIISCSLGIWASALVLAQVVICFLIPAQETLAQLPDYQWTRSPRGLSGKWLTIQQGLISRGPDGSLYIGGWFEGETVDFDPTIVIDERPNAGGKDFFLAKYDTAGQSLWAYTMGGSGDDLVTSVTNDASGNVYITGTFQDSVDFDPGNTMDDHTCPESLFCFFLSKYTASGNYSWTRAVPVTDQPAINGSYFESLLKTKVSSTGEVYVTGKYVGTVDFNPEASEDIRTSGSTRGDLFVSKYSSDGSYIWTITLPCLNAYTDVFNFSISIDNAENIVLAGSFQGPIDFDPGPGTVVKNGWSSYVSKYTSAGAHLWTQTIYNVETGLHSVITDSDQNIYVAGRFKGSIDFDPGVGTDIQTSDVWGAAFVSKYDLSGVYLWTKAFSNDWLRAPSIAADSLGGIYLTGSFNETADFDPSAGTDYQTSDSSSEDAFLVKLNTSGAYQWARTFGGSQSDSGVQIDVSADNTVYLTATVSGRIDLDPGNGTDQRLTQGSYDLLHARYDVLGSYLGAWTLTGPSEAAAPLLATDGNGAVLYGGWYNGSLDFDPGPDVDLREGAVWGSSFLTKYDARGEYQYTITLDSGQGDYRFTALATGTDNRFFLTGNFKGSLDFDPGFRTVRKTSHESYSSFLTSYSAAGEHLWTNAYEGDLYIFELSSLSPGVVHMIGFFSGPVDFDPGIAADVHDGGNDGLFFIAKYDSNGNYMGIKTYGGATQSVSSAAISSAGDIFVAGTFSGTVDFNPEAGVDNHTSGSEYNLFVSKFDANGHYLWTITIEGTGYIYYPLIKLDRDQNLYLNAEVNGTLDYDSGSGTDLRTPRDPDHEGASCWVKYDAQGTYQWTNLIQPNSYIWYMQTVIADGNKPFLLGRYSWEIDLDPGDGTDLHSALAGGWTGFVSRYDTQGNYLGSFSGFYAGASTEGSIGEAFLMNADGTFYSSGALGWSPADFYPGNSNSHREAEGLLDAFLSKYSFDVSSLPPAITSPITGTTSFARRPVFRGTAEPGSEVALYRDGLLIGTATVDSRGDWQYTASSDWEYRTYTINAVARDGSGNVSSSSNSLVLTIFNLETSDLDRDGLTWGQEVVLLTDPNDPDTDDDSVIDGQEVIDSTNPLDRGSFRANLNATLCAEWNGFLGMWNVVEHVNIGTRKIAVESNLHDIFGRVQGTYSFGFDSGTQHDLLVHNMAGHQADSYGLLCSAATNISPGSLDGRMVFYKPDAVTGGYQFAYATTLSGGHIGSQYLLYNTYQPSLDPADSANLAANWVQVTNLENDQQTGVLLFYSREGQEIARQAVTLARAARFDFAVHDLAGRSQVGLVGWIPTAASARSQLRNVRYYYRADGEKIPLGDDFDSALQLEGLVGTGQLLSVPLDTNGSSAVLEIANTLDEKTTVDVSIYAANGGDPRHVRTYALNPHATLHLITDSILNGGKGIATIKPGNTESVIATAMHYGRTATLGIQTAYGVQASEAIGSVVRGSYNTFLKQACRLLMVNPTNSEIVATVSMKRYDGTDVELGRMLAVPAHGLTDYDLCSKDQENAYGVVTVQTDSANSIIATVLRIGASEQYRFPTAVR